MIPAAIGMLDGGVDHFSWYALERKTLYQTPGALLDGAYGTFDFMHVVVGVCDI